MLVLVSSACPICKRTLLVAAGLVERLPWSSRQRNHCAQEITFPAELARDADSATVFLAYPLEAIDSGPRFFGYLQKYCKPGMCAFLKLQEFVGAEAAWRPFSTPARIHMLGVQL